MIVGIDASNIRAGGGITHLSCLLGSFEPGAYGIKKVVVWGGGKTICNLPERAGVELCHVPALDGPLPLRLAWQRWIFPGRIAEAGCAVLFSPGGILPAGISIPSVAMSQNMLPFEPREASRFAPLSFMRLKMVLLSAQQRRSMAMAGGLIFLTQYARKTVLPALRRHTPQVAVIPHGIEQRFFCTPRPALPLDSFSSERPFRLLYVSIVDVYKHQWRVAEAVAALHAEGVPVEISFVGPAYPPALKLLLAALERLNPEKTFLRYVGPIPFEELAAVYRQADGFVFASSCENMPNILLEAMAAGLPIACSNRGPMPEVLGDAGVYFDPERTEQIIQALRELLDDPQSRERRAGLAFAAARAYSWERCAKETFAFIAQYGTRRSLRMS